MVYKINGNVVIDDSGNLTSNLVVFAPVATPTNVSPPDEDVDTDFADLVLEMTDYEGLYKGTIPLKFAQFQVANVNTFAEGNIVYDSGNAAPLSSNTIPISLDQQTTFYWRGRYINNNDVFTSFSNVTSFTTKEVPTILGQSFGGGYYTGTIDIGGGTCYYLIVAPNSGGCACCCWKTSLTSTAGSCSGVDGYGTTYTVLNSATHPAGNWTATRTIGGFTDWYLPAASELGVLSGNRGSMPVGEGYNSQRYWSSTEFAAPAACINFMDQNVFSDWQKNCFGITRAVRRIPV